MITDAFFSTTINNVRLSHIYLQCIYYTHKRFSSVMFNLCFLFHMSLNLIEKEPNDICQENNTTQYVLLFRSKPSILLLYFVYVLGNNIEIVKHNTNWPVDNDHTKSPTNDHRTTILKLTCYRLSIRRRRKL